MQFERAQVEPMPGELQRLGGKRRQRRHRRWRGGRRRVGRTAQPLPPPQQPAYARQQDRQLERLGQVVVGPAFEPHQHVFGTGPRREHQNRHEIALGAQRARHVEAVLAGQPHVEHHGIELVALDPQQGHGGGAIAFDVHVVAIGGEVEAQALGDVLLIFDDQDAAHATRSGASLGNSSVNVAPSPSPWLSANTRPPCWRAIERTM